MPSHRRDGEPPAGGWPGKPTGRSEDDTATMPGEVVEALRRKIKTGAMRARPLADAALPFGPAPAPAAAPTPAAASTTGPASPPPPEPPPPPPAIGSDSGFGQLHTARLDVATLQHAAERSHSGSGSPRTVQMQAWTPTPPAIPQAAPPGTVVDDRHTPVSERPPPLPSEPPAGPSEPASPSLGALAFPSDETRAFIGRPEPALPFGAPQGPTTSPAPGPAPSPAPSPALPIAVPPQAEAAVVGSGERDFPSSETALHAYVRPQKTLPFSPSSGSAEVLIEEVGTYDEPTGPRHTASFAAVPAAALPFQSGAQTLDPLAPAAEPLGAFAAITPNPLAASAPEAVVAPTPAPSEIPPPDDDPPIALDVYAKIKIAVWDDAEPLDRALTRHELGEMLWREHELWQEARIAAEAEQGTSTWAAALRNALKDVRAARGSDKEGLTLERYAELRVALEDVPDELEVLAEAALDRSGWEHEKQRWDQRLRDDRGLSRKLRRTMARVRRKRARDLARESQASQPSVAKHA